MPTILSHPAVPLALGLGLGRERIPGPLLAAGIIVSILPDLDVVGLALGIPYGNALGHRGFSHSLLAAGLVTVFGALLFRKLRVPYGLAAAFLFVAMASHGALDALTTGGKGIAFLWPFSDRRFFAPFQLIRVSPLGLSRFLSARGAAVLLSELLWIWLPCAGVAALLLSLRPPRPADR